MSTSSCLIPSIFTLFPDKTLSTIRCRKCWCPRNVRIFRDPLIVALGGGASRAAAFALDFVESERAGAMVEVWFEVEKPMRSIKARRSFQNELKPTFRRLGFGSVCFGGRNPCSAPLIHSGSFVSSSSSLSFEPHPFDVSQNHCPPCKTSKHPYHIMVSIGVPRFSWQLHACAAAFASQSNLTYHSPASLLTVHHRPSPPRSRPQTSKDRSTGRYLGVPQARKYHAMECCHRWTW
jgi:hypothetical protein